MSDTAARALAKALIAIALIVALVVLICTGHAEHTWWIIIVAFLVMS